MITFIVSASFLAIGLTLAVLHKLALDSEVRTDSWRSWPLYAYVLSRVVCPLGLMGLIASLILVILSAAN